MYACVRGDMDMARWLVTEVGVDPDIGEDGVRVV
jgi:hypothetical protein